MAQVLNVLVLKLVFLSKKPAVNLRPLAVLTLQFVFQDAAAGNNYPAKIVKAQVLPAAMPANPIAF